MDNRMIEEKLIQVINNPDDESIRIGFINDYVSLLDEQKVSIDTANLAIKCINIDKGANLLDVYSQLDKKTATEAFKTIRECDEFKKNNDNNALKLMCAFLAFSFDGDANTNMILNGVINSIVSKIKVAKQGAVKPETLQVLSDYIIGEVTKDTKLPDLKEFKITPENVICFCDVLGNSLVLFEEKKSIDDIPVVKKTRDWLELSRKQAEEAKELREIEKNKPERKSEELGKLVEHFKNLEDELDKTVQECASLVLEKKNLQKEIGDLEYQKQQLSGKIAELEKDKRDLNFKIEEIQKVVDERTKLNEAQVQYREDAQNSLLEDIARALKAEYGDYIESKDSPMDEMLGEIYREKLKQIFKILEQNGIKVEA